MEHTEERAAASPVDTIRTRVKQLRGHRGWTAAELGKQMTRHGLKWDRSIVANFEAGRRRTVSVDELLALALVFDVAPVNLLVPVTDEPYRASAIRTMSADTVREWVRGNKPLPGTSTEAQRTFYAEVAMADIKRRGHIIPIGTARVRDEARDPSGEHPEAPER
ncbi:helix-turn-helix transcriptional regulator [Streptomyces antibioticus]|uniref:helix-turn-helix transcriptional regulator n=1 Tax=Streptomyces antibioticus TaxID=1890 RepID=UPI003717604F